MHGCRNRWAAAQARQLHLPSPAFSPPPPSFCRTQLPFLPRYPLPQLRQAPGDCVDVFNQLIDLRLANDTNAHALAECAGQLADCEGSLQEQVANYQQLVQTC